MARAALFKSSSFLTRLRADIASTVRIVRLYPSTLLWPALVLGLVLGLGVWGVVRMGQLEEASAKSRAAALALDTAIWFRQQLSVAIAPVLLMSAMVEYDPQYGAASRLLGGLAPAILQQTPLRVVRQLELVPAGIVRNIYTQDDGHNTSVIVGRNLFETDDREGALKTVEDKALTLVGPMSFVEGGYGVIVRTPIFIVSNANETFGIPDWPNLHCGAPCDYNTTTGTVFWGFAAALVDLEMLAASPDSKLRTLVDMGYRYEVWAMGIADADRRLVSSSPIRPSNSVQEVISLPNNEWVVRVSPAGSWKSQTVGALMTAVVVASLALAFMMFVALVSRRRHEMLLKALLPKEVIKDLRSTNPALLDARIMQAETTAELMLSLLGQLLEGYMPDLREVVFIRQAILRGADLYQPMDLTGHIRDANLDKDVARALIQQLGNDKPASLLATHDDDMLLPDEVASPATLRAAASFTTKGLTTPCPDCSTLAGALALILTPQPAAWRDVVTETGLGDAASDVGWPAREMVDGGSLASPRHSNTSSFFRVSSLVRDTPGGGLNPAYSLGATSALLNNPHLTANISHHHNNHQNHHQNHHGHLHHSHLLHHLHPQQPCLAPGRLSRGGTGELFRDDVNARQLLQQQQLLLLHQQLQQHQHTLQQPQPQPLTSGQQAGQSSTLTPQPCSPGGQCKRLSLSAGEVQQAAAGGAPRVRSSRIKEEERADGSDGSSDSDGHTTAHSGLTSTAEGSTATSRRSSSRRPPRRVASALAAPTRAVAALRRRSLLLIKPSCSTNGTADTGGSGTAATPSPSALTPPGGPPGASNGQRVGSTNGEGRAGGSGCTQLALANGGGGSGGSGEGPMACSTADMLGMGLEQTTIRLALGPTAAGMKPSLLGPSRGTVASRLQALPPSPSIIEEVEQVLSKADSWQFDTWKLRDATNGHPLSALGFYLIHRTGLLEQFNLKADKLARLLRAVEAGYNDNPYHNATHAADVLQTLHVIIHGAQMHVHYLDPLRLLAAYFAAIVHDYGHPGLTNDFLVATSDPLAVRYNDRSPLENHHAAAAFSLMAKTEMDVLAPLTKTDRTTIRKQVIEMVLATDMKQHFSLLSQFATLHRLSGFAHEPPPETLTRSTPSAVGRAGGSVELSEVVVNPANGARGVESMAPKPLDETERLLSLQIAIKAADLGHLGEGMEVHKRWLTSLEEEFFRQGDKERQLGIPISPLFDRAKQGVSKSQVGFYDFVALPLVHALASAFPGTQPLMTCFLANYNHWRGSEGQPPVGMPAPGKAVPVASLPSPAVLEP